MTVHLLCTLAIFSTAAGLRQRRGHPGRDAHEVSISSTCDSQWNNMACANNNGQQECYTCGDRITWLVSQGSSEQAAKTLVATEFPSECGACGEAPSTTTSAGPPAPTPPTPPSGIPLDTYVFIRSHRDQNLHDNNGSVGLTVNASTWETWVLSDAGNGKVTIKSHRSEHLQDANGQVGLSPNTQSWEQWTVSDAGAGKVVFTSHRGEHLQDDNDQVKMSSGLGSWEAWTIVEAPPPPTPAPTPAPAPPPPGCVDLLLIADHGSRQDLQWRVAAGLSQIAAFTQPQAILAIGDNIYENGAEGGFSLITSWWSNVYLQYESLRRPWYMVNGNHDWYTDGRVQVDFTSSSQNSGGFWQFPSLWYKRTFSSAAVSADFFFIDTMVWRKSSNVARYMDAEQEYTNQRNWLIGELAASTADWRIIAGHHPVYSAGVHGITAELLDDLDPIMRQYNVPIYIAGHDHSKQYIRYTGMHYIVSGAGGKYARDPSYETPPDSLIEFIRDGGFAGLQICDDAQATLKYYSDTGSVQATHQIANERPEQPPPSVRRRRRAVDMWACRRRSSTPGNADYGYTPDGYVCSGNSIVPQTVQVAQRPLTAFFNTSSTRSKCGGVTLQNVDKQCSADGCTVQPDRPRSESCEHYCRDHGLTCVAAWTHSDESCVAKSSLDCSAVLRSPEDGHLSDSLLCSCSK